MTYCLEMRNTAEWPDCRYREYTRSAARAERFKQVPRINFTDSGHGLVPHVYEPPLGARRLPAIRHCAAHVRQHMVGAPRCPRMSAQPAIVTRLMARVAELEAEVATLRRVYNVPGSIG